MKLFQLYLTLFLGVFFTSLTSAQEVTYSQYEKFDLRTDEYGIVGMCGGKLFTYISNVGSPALIVYDDSMVKRATVLLDFFPEKIYEVKFITYADKIVILYQSQESNKIVQYAAVLDDRGLLKGKPIELGSTKTGILGANRVYYSSAISDNKKYIVIYSANDRGSTIEFEGKWLDDNLTILKKSKATFKADNTVEHGDVVLGNDGVLYMTAYTEVGSLNYADQFWILKLGVGATKFDAKELPLEDKYAASGYMKLDNVNNKVYFGGFYALKKNGSFDGVLYADLDISSGQYKTTRFIPFDKDLLMTASIGHRNHPFDNYVVKQLIVKNDGGFVLISEVYFVTTRSNYTPGFGYYSAYNSPYSTTNIREYHCDDIMALSYNNNGERVWSSFIPKVQYSQEDGGAFSSYGLLNSGGTLAFMFNDFNMARSSIQLATIDANGATDIHAFSPEGNDQPDWLPKSGKQVSGRVMVVPCFRKRQICFARVEL